MNDQLLFLVWSPDTARTGHRFPRALFVIPHLTRNPLKAEFHRFIEPTSFVAGPPIPKSPEGSYQSKNGQFL
jgi:hypothetical protein